MVASTPRHRGLAPALLTCTTVLALACQGPQPNAAAPGPAMPTPPATAAEASPPVDDAPTLQTYAAPPGRAGELANVLQRVLRGRGETPAIGKATAMDSEHVVVLAPASVHAGVEQLCTEMKQAKAPPGQRIQISYWVVRAEAAESTDASSVPAIADALVEVAEQLGPATFTLVERAMLTSMLNAHARTESRFAEFSQTATAHEGGIVADIDIKMRGAPGDGHGQLQSRVAIGDEETVIVGQNGLTEDRDARVFYIVRAELVDAA